VTVPLIDARGLSKRFVKRLDLAGRIAQRLGSRISEEVVHAVDGVDLVIRPGEVVGLVGESGCGKSTLGRMIAGIMPPTEGEILFEGMDVAVMQGAERRAADLAVQMIFQDPFASLNPRMRVEQIVGEAPFVHGLVDRAGLSGYVDDVLMRVGLDPALKRRYPHQFSGGQRQRIAIARAMVLRPRLLVLDEPTSALDMTVQVQIVELLRDLQKKYGLAYLFISHDLKVVRAMSHKVLVMKRGDVVEYGDADTLYDNPTTDYTRQLLQAAT